MRAEAYEVLAVRYGTRQASAAEVFLNYHAYREPDRELRMDYFFWVARNPSRTVIATSGGPVILASDAVHYYEELERDRPFSTVANLADMYAAFDQIRELAAQPGACVVAGHDPLVAERFPARARSANAIRIST